MKKLQIIDNTYYQLLVGVVITLIFYTIYSLVISQNLLLVIALLFQSILLYLLITKNIWCQRAIRIWLFIGFLGSSIVKIFSNALLAWARNMKDEEGAFEYFNSSKIIYSVILILVGIILWILNTGFGEVVDTKEIE